MAVYVDSLGPCIANKNWRYKEACHLMADTVDELHEFAETIGMKRSWFRVSNSGLPHYDLTRGKRKQAVKSGAIEIDNNQVLGYIQKWRKRMYEEIAYNKLGMNEDDYKIRVLGEWK